MQAVAVVAEHPNSILESPRMHNEVLGVTVQKLYPKRPCDAKAEEVINRSLAKNQDAEFGGKEEEPIAENQSHFQCIKSINQRTARC